MFRSLVLVVLVGCYDEPAIVLHVTRDSTDLDADLVVCNDTAGKCDPDPYLVGTARIFGDTTALKRDVSIFDDHGGTVDVRYKDLGQNMFCVHIVTGSAVVERHLEIKVNGASWDFTESVDTSCGPQ